MITVGQIRQIINEHLQDSPLFVTRVTVKLGNKISVFIDGEKGVGIADCAQLSRYIDSKLDREQEDYELEVSSHGIDRPLELPRQFIHNAGRSIRVLLKDGSVITGKLLKADENGFIVETLVREKPRGKGIAVSRAFDYSEYKEVKIIVSFK